MNPDFLMSTRGSSIKTHTHAKGIYQFSFGIVFFVSSAMSLCSPVTVSEYQVAIDHQGSQLLFQSWQPRDFGRATLYGQRKLACIEW